MAKILSFHDPVCDTIEKAYSIHFDALYAYALVLIRDQHLAKDVISDVFLNLYRREINVKNIQHLRSYLFTCVKHQAIHLQSRDSLFVKGGDHSEWAACVENINPEDLMMYKELEEFLDICISHLSQQCRRVFEMVRVEQMSYESVSIELEISIDTVKYHMKTAMRNIRENLILHFNKEQGINWSAAIGALLTVVLFLDWC